MYKPALSRAQCAAPCLNLRLPAQPYNIFNRGTSYDLLTPTWLLSGIHSSQPLQSLHCQCGHPPTTSHQLIHPPSHSLHATVRSTAFAHASIGPENSLSNYISCSFKDKPVLQRSPHVMHAPYNLVHVLPQHPSQDCAPVNPPFP